uniref:hypothetical protein n=1 Tax=Agathobacter sp. TaxID=2021311 RepID=UPI004056F090
MNLMMKQKTFQFVFILMLLISITVPIYHVVAYWGFYQYALPSSDTLYIGNNAGACWEYLALLFPFMIVLPYGLSFMNESKSGVILYVQTRGERKYYYYGQLIACFAGTAIVFLLPFLLNILLNLLLFPINGNDYVSTYNAYDINWVNTIMGRGFFKETLFDGYVFKQIAIDHPQLYNVMYAIGTSFAAGIMGMFIYAVSIIFQKNALSLLIANYLFFMIFTVLDRIFEEGNLGLYINTNLTDYLSNGHFNQGRVYPLYLLFLLCEVVGSVSIIKHRLRKDEL